LILKERVFNKGKMKKILVVEDARYMSETIAMMLEESYEIVGVAVNGREAISKYKEEKPDLVTMDLVMDEMDGIQAIREIKRYDPDALILVISALGSPEQMDEAMEAGADEYLWKPFTVKIIQEVVEKLLSIRMGPKQESEILSALERSGEKTEIVMYLHKIYPNTADNADISKYTGIDPSDSLGALREMGLVDMIERDKVTSYKLSERGKSLIDAVEPPSIFYDWAHRRDLHPFALDDVSSNNSKTITYFESPHCYVNASKSRMRSKVINKDGLSHLYDFQIFVVSSLKIR
jgi:two-component system chemotaxis response regulator CheY